MRERYVDTRNKLAGLGTEYDDNSDFLLESSSGTSERGYAPSNSRMTGIAVLSDRLSSLATKWICGNGQKMEF